MGDRIPDMKLTAQMQMGQMGGFGLPRNFVVWKLEFSQKAKQNKIKTLRLALVDHADFCKHFSLVILF